MSSGRLCEVVVVVDVLPGQDGVEEEAGDETVEDLRVRDFLEGGEDADGAAEEVVEYLDCIFVSLSCLNGAWHAKEYVYAERVYREDIQ